jgi:hypothetical protein
MAARGLNLPDGGAGRGRRHNHWQLENISLQETRFGGFFNA